MYFSDNSTHYHLNGYLNNQNKGANNQNKGANNQNKGANNQNKGANNQNKGANNQNKGITIAKPIDTYGFETSPITNTINITNI